MAIVEAMAKSAFRQMLRSLFKMAKNTVLVFLGLIPAVIIGDSKGHVHEHEASWSQVSQWASALLWVSLFPFMIWQARAMNPVVLWVLTLALPLAFFWFGRRFSAARGREMTVRQFASKLGVVFETRWARPLIISGLAIMAAGAGLAALPHFPAYLDATQGAFTDVLPWYPLAFLSGYWLTLPVAARAGFLSAVDDRDAVNTKQSWDLNVAAILGISASEWDSAQGKHSFDESGVLTATNLPVAARTRFSGIEARCEQIAPAYTVGSVDWNTLLLVPIETVPEIKASREAKSASNGLISRFRNEPDTLVRPSAIVWTISDAVKLNAGQIDAFAKGQGMRLVELHEADREAVIAKLTPLVQQVRARLAGLLGSPEHAVELAIAMDSATGQRIESVEVMRYPNLGADRAKRKDLWKHLIAAIPGGSTGWAIDDNAVTGCVVLTYGESRILPKLLDGKLRLPKSIDIENWAEFPVGVNDAGETVNISLTAGPHTLVVGGTGSGKSVALRSIISNGLAHGFDVVIVDPVKKAAGLKDVAPWTRGIFTSGVDQAAAALGAIYAEVRRRVDLIDAAGGENWRGLPTGTVKPMLVVIDEYFSLTTPDEKPVGIPMGEPEMIEWAAEASAKAKIKSVVGKMAREARSAGIHLVISLQRPDASAVGGSVRENLGTILQMVVPSRPPSPEALRMIFPTDYVPYAMDEIETLNDGVSKGFALSYVEGGGVQGFRVGFLDVGDMAEYAERLSIPLGIPLILPDAEPPAGTAVWRKKPAPAPSVPQSQPPVEVVELGAFVFDLDDLDVEPVVLDTPMTADEPFAEPVRRSPVTDFTFSFDD